jgi:CheY-like chemotaxis protein
MKKKLNCVLLVDDNESDNFLHRKVLEKSGIADHIEVVMNGKEALDFITGKGKGGKGVSPCSPPELIFLDINMPVMDGWEFLEEYQKLDDIKKGGLVIIMLTTSLNPDDRKIAEKIIGVNGFKYKQLTLEMINEIIKTNFPENL